MTLRVVAVTLGVERITVIMIPEVSFCYFVMETKKIESHSILYLGMPAPDRSRVELEG
jgi:hypothetical protein